MVTLTWHASKCKVHELNPRYIILFCFAFFVIKFVITGKFLLPVNTGRILTSSFIVRFKTFLKFENFLLVEFMKLYLFRVPAENYYRRLRSLLCPVLSCDVGGQVSVAVSCVIV